MWSPLDCFMQSYRMEPTETEKPTIETRAFSDESGATPLTMEDSVAQIPRQIDPMASHHEDSSFKSWSLNELLSQKRLIGTYPITSSQKNGTMIYQFRHTYENVASIFLQNDANLIFSCTSWKLHFRMEFRSNFQQVGQVLVSQHCIPAGMLTYLLSMGDPGDFPKSYYYMTMIPHVKVPLGEDTDVEVTMDWNAPTGSTPSRRDAYLNPSTTELQIYPIQYDMGSLYVTVGQQMQIAEKVNPNAYVRVWAYLTDLKYGAYTPVSTFL